MGQLENIIMYYNHLFKNRSLQEMLEDAINDLNRIKIERIDAALKTLKTAWLPNGIRYDELLVISSYYPLSPELQEYFGMVDWDDIPIEISRYQKIAFGESRLIPNRIGNHFIFVSDVAQSLHLDPFEVEAAFIKYANLGLMTQFRRRGKYDMDIEIRSHLQDKAVEILSEETRDYLKSRALPLIDMIEVSTLRRMYSQTH